MRVYYLIFTEDFKYQVVVTRLADYINWVMVRKGTRKPFVIHDSQIICQCDKNGKKIDEINPS